jgi:hypothetical protein
LVSVISKPKPGIESHSARHGCNKPFNRTQQKACKNRISSKMPVWKILFKFISMRYGLLKQKRAGASKAGHEKIYAKN